MNNTFYITREWHCMGGRFMPFQSWYEYSIETSKPSSDKCFVKINKSKEYLKKLAISKGGLEEALEYLFDIEVDNEEIEGAFK